MEKLVGLSSECICKRRFSWRRILEPAQDKNDPSNWVVCFGPGAGVPIWDEWCSLIAAEVVNRDKWGVLLVTAESPQSQLHQTLYHDFDCAYVRTLSDTSGRVGAAFGIELQQGSYPFAVLYIQNGKMVPGPSRLHAM